MSTRFTPVVGVIALCSALTACGSSGSGGSGSFAPSGKYAGSDPAAGPAATAVPSTMTRPQIDKAVLDRYREYQRIYKAAYERNDPSQLSGVAMDPLLSIITRDIQSTSAKGEIWRFTSLSNPKIQGYSKDNATIFISDCVKTIGAYRFSARTGKRLGSYRGGSFLYRLRMSYSQDTWKVSNSKQVKKC